MQRYNIALLPVDPDIRQALTEISRRFFERIHDEYVLGHQALPHVTLCHFRSGDEKKGLAAFKAFPRKEGLTLNIKDFCVRPGTRINPGKFIAEYQMEMSKELASLQKVCLRHLEESGLTALAAGDGYSPHMTMARLAFVPEILPSLKDLPFKDNIAFRIALGIGTESGVFVREAG
jgi:2'-5' RNA ligase